MNKLQLLAGVSFVQKSKDKGKDKESIING